ncbi:hypothetical protein EON67_02780, partial [archaeon]
MHAYSASVVRAKGGCDAEKAGDAKWRPQCARRGRGYDLWVPTPALEGFAVAIAARPPPARRLAAA